MPKGNKKSSPVRSWHESPEEAELVENKQGRPHQYKETEAVIARAFAQYGIPEVQLCRYLKIAKTTLYRLYGDVMAQGRAVANHKVAERLYKKAVEDGDTAALIFWCKTQMGWRETQHIDVSSQDGSMTPQITIDLSNKTQGELMELVDAAWALEAQEKDRASLPESDEDFED